MNTPIDMIGVAIPIDAKDKPASINKTLKTVSKILASDNPIDFINKAEVDLLAIYKNLGWIALNAELVAKDRDGEPISLGRDNRCQISASLAILELAQHIKSKTVVAVAGIFNDEKVVADANRVLALRSKGNNN